MNCEVEGRSVLEIDGMPGEMELLLMVRILSGESFPPGMYKTPVNTLDIYHISWWRVSDPSTESMGFEQF